MGRKPTELVHRVLKLVGLNLNRSEAMPSYHHRVYGIGIESPWPMCTVSPGSSRETAVCFVEEFGSITPPNGTRVCSNGFSECSFCPDGSIYLTWKDLFEFLISPDGRHIASRALAGSS